MDSKVCNSVIIFTEEIVKVSKDVLGVVASRLTESENVLNGSEIVKEIDQTFVTLEVALNGSVMIVEMTGVMIASDVMIVSGEMMKGEPSVTKDLVSIYHLQ